MRAHRLAANGQAQGRCPAGIGLRARRWVARLGMARLSVVLGTATLGGAALAACGGPTLLRVEPLQPPRQVRSAPPQSAEEREGEVPPLRGVPDKRPVVPKALVPPAPPADPEPGW